MHTLWQFQNTYIHTKITLCEARTQIFCVTKPFFNHFYCRPSCFQNFVNEKARLKKIILTFLFSPKPGNLKRLKNEFLQKTTIKASFGKANSTSFAKHSYFLADTCLFSLDVIICSTLLGLLRLKVFVLY